MACTEANLILSIPCMEIAMEQILFESKNLHSTCVWVCVHTTIQRKEQYVK